MLDSFPPGARFAFGCRRIGLLSLGAFTGLTLGCLIAFAVAWVNDSPPSGQALVNFPIAWVCLHAFAALGWIVGVFTRSWFVPPLLAVLPFAVLIGNVLNARVFIAVFEGMSYTAILNVTSWDMYLASVVSFCALAATGFALLAWWARRYSRRGVPLVVVSFSLLVGAAAMTNFVYDNTELFTDVDSSSWPCAKMEKHDVDVCIPPDQERDLQMVASDLPRYYERIVQVDSSLSGRIWSLIDDPEGTALLYDLPMGKPASESAQGAAIVSGLFSRACLARSEVPNDVLDAYETLRLWVEPWTVSDIPRSPVTLDEAKAAYRHLESCE
jgi:hypothetical protein